MPLEEYNAKRDFTHTPEPAGGGANESGGAKLSFVVQKHHASSLHYDFRLELDGVLLSWAVPKGPSLDTRDKRLAIRVEDHPLSYGSFEGTIPEGEYGGGSVIVWDRGTWEPLGDPHAGLAKGDFKFTLSGEKLRGVWVLVRLKPRPNERQESWLLIKERDDFARPRETGDILAERPESVVSGLGVDEVGRRDPPATATVGREAATPPPAVVDLELATLVERPPEGNEWLAEVKYDGYRVAIVLDGGRARVFTRSHADWTDRFAPLALAVEGLPATSAVIDGEAVVFDERGISRFDLLQHALGEHPEKIGFAAFDLLHLNGHDLRNLPLIDRKELLCALLCDRPAGSPLRYADHVIGGAPEFFREACRADLEGTVCKRAASRYVPGRGRDWLKVKCRQVQEFVVGGFTEGAGSRVGLGSLLLGVYDGARFAYAGRVGTGFDDATLAALRDRLDALETPAPPFEPPPHITGHTLHWVRPTLVVQVAFREWTADNVLRQPVYLGLREDKAASEVAREASSTEAPPKASAAEGGPAAESGQVEGSAKGFADSDAMDGRDPLGREPSPLPSPPPDRGRRAVLGVPISNPDKLLFPASDFPKFALAEYYAAVAPLMLPLVANRPLTLVRCPHGGGAGCFYQRHPDAGLPHAIHVLPHALGSTREMLEWLTVDTAEGLIALAQMGAVEVHAWLSRADAPARPDLLVFDLDPGPDLTRPQIRAVALLVRDECASLGFTPYLKSTGGKGLHVVMPIEPVWDFTRVRVLTKALAERLAALHPNTITSRMAKDLRGGRVFLDYLRNAEGASAVAPYSTRNRPGPTCSVPLAWDELTDELDTGLFTPARVLARVAAGTDPWRTIAENPASERVLRAAEKALGLG
ncbi:MAG: DNA ligase D [Coriobacteriia bacterium]|nr:DNA ligase D [Coriobacteriia bacterium]